ncbi:MAG: insulinase family protein [Acidobacteriota bacterium]|nr:insulinase family protein [Acidobacteriota bacterium]
MGLLIPAVPLLGQKPVQHPPSTQSASRPPSQAANPPAVTLAPLPVESHRLANGLEIVTLENHRAPIVSLQVWYHVGSKDERRGQTGFAHIFEHLMADGSAHVGPGEESRLIEQVGGTSNAYTNDDATVFSETFPARYLARVLWLEADRMGSLNITQANFDDARQILGAERREHIDGPPYGRVTEDLYAAAFTLHPYHHITIGPMTDLDKATLARIRDFYSAFYRPNNATLVIVGDFSTPEVLASAQKYFGGIPASPSPVPRVTAKEPPQTSQRRVTRSYANSPLPAVIEAFHVPSRFSANQYPLVLASAILSQGPDARLRHSLVDSGHLALQVIGAGNFTEDPNLLFVGAILTPGHSAADGEKAVNAVIEKMRIAPVEPSELDRAWNQTAVRLIENRATDQGLADQIGEAAVVGHNPALVNQELSRYLRVSAADIERVCREYLTTQQSTVLLVEPQAASQGAPPGK